MMNRRALLCVWLTILALTPLYIIFAGGKSKNDSKVESTRRGVSAAQEDYGLLKRGVHALENTDKQDHLAFEELCKGNRNICSQTIRDEIRRAFSKGNTSNPRVAFERVVLVSSLLPKISNISRIKTPSPEAFRNYMAPIGLPVIFTDMLEGEKLADWTWEYVRSKWGHIVYHNTRQGEYSGKVSKLGKHYVNRVSVRLADFIDIVTNKRRPEKSEEGMYITKQRVIPVEALEQEFTYPKFYPGVNKKCYLEPTGWIGSPGTFTQGHIDSKDNFVYQVIGEKRWTIFSPQDYENLYYTKTKGSLEWSSVLNSFNLDNVDLNQYPLYAKTTPITFTMRPGEVLYLPRGWTHTVANLSPALMINTWRYGPAAITEHWSEKNRQEIRKKCF